MGSLFHQNINECGLFTISLGPMKTPKRRKPNMRKCSKRGPDIRQEKSTVPALMLHMPHSAPLSVIMPSKQQRRIVPAIYQPK